MRAGLIGQQIGNEISLHHFRKDVGAVANQTDRGRALCLSRLVDQLQCLIERWHHVVAIAGRKPFLDPCRIHLNPDEACAIHGRGQRLRAAHSTEPAADDEFTREISIEMFFPGRAKGFERALHNSLAADVNPGTGRHLSIHRQPEPFEFVELLVVRPITNEIGIRDQYSWGFIVGAEFADRLARLNEQGLVVFKPAQRTDNRIETFPISGRPPGAAVNDQSIRRFRDFRIEIVHQHPQGRFLVPAFATAFWPAWRTN